MNTALKICAHELCTNEGQGIWRCIDCNEIAESPTLTAIAIYEASGHTYVATRHRSRIEALVKVLAEHPETRVEFCADERTGQRYGQAQCRAGRCEKIGYTTFTEQAWAVW